MSILLSDTSFAQSQVQWTYSGLYQQAYGSLPINQLRNCSPQTNYSLVEHFRYFVTYSKHFPFVEQCSTVPPTTCSEQFRCKFIYARYIRYSHNYQTVNPYIYITLFVSVVTPMVYIPLQCFDSVGWILRSVKTLSPV